MRLPAPPKTSEGSIVGLPSSERVLRDAAPALGEGRQPTSDAMGIVEPTTGGVRLHVAEEVEVSVARLVRASPIESAAQAGVDAKGRATSAAGTAAVSEIARSVSRRSCTAASTFEPRKLSIAPPERPSTSASTRMPLVPR